VGGRTGFERGDDGMSFAKFKLETIFDAANGDFDIQQKHISDKGEFVVSSGETNTGVIGKSDVNAKVFPENTITVDMFGFSYFRGYKYKMVTHARVFSLNLKDGAKMTRESGLYFVSQLQFLRKFYSYNNMASWKKVKNEEIELPITATGEIDFRKMEERIRELEAYLKVTGLSDYVLTDEDKQVLAAYRERERE
jgi:hypothetical protein